jgi:hypothetical protein
MDEMMFADALPPPPQVNAEQAGDLRCVSAGLLMKQSSAGRSAGERMVRIYLHRLAQSDGGRDWKAMAKPLPADITYGEFMGVMNECTVRIDRRPVRSSARQ